jgi:hypothetical protein
MTTEQEDTLNNLQAMGYPTHVVRKENSGVLNVVTLAKLHRGFLQLMIAHDGLVRHIGREYRFSDIRSSN